jgi:hypothetical protein
MAILEQLVLFAAPIGIGAAALAAIIFVWKRIKKHVGCEYGPETLPSGEVRMRLTLSLKIPSNRKSHRATPAEPDTSATERDAA